MTAAPFVAGRPNDVVVDLREISPEIHQVPEPGVLADRVEIAVGTRPFPDVRRLRGTDAELASNWLIEAACD